MSRCPSESMHLVDSLPDPDSLSDRDLKSLLDTLGANERELVREESEGSYKLRILHGKIELIRASLIERRRRAYGGDEPDV